MKRDHENLDEILDRYLPSAAESEMEADGERVWNRLRSRAEEHPVRRMAPAAVATDFGRRRIFAVLAAAAVLLLAFIGTVIFQRPTDALAVVESADGLVYRASDVVYVGEKIGLNETLRSEGSTMLALTDGTRVEMRSKSELWLERADDGVRIRLEKGGLIVNAATQPSGRRLYVQTKDVTVSVVGTVFLVNAEEEGSRVAVIEGEVRVKQGETEKSLRPGEQVSTNSLMESPFVSEEIAWSRSAPAHLALLQQASSPGATAGTGPREAFDVASIRPSTTTPPPTGRGAGPGGGPPGPCGGLFDNRSVRVEPKRFVADATTLYRLIALAYGKNCRASLESNLIAGAPGSIRSDLFDIQAVLPDGSPGYTVQQLQNGEAPKLQMMLQALLADRFKLALHREMKEMPVYNLVVVQSGKLKLSEDQSPPPDPATRAVSGDYLSTVQALKSSPRGILNFFIFPVEGKVKLSGTAVPLSSLMNYFQGGLGRPVLDKTEIKGRFDIPDQTLDVGPFDVVSGPPVWPQILEQLGFKLEAARAPVEVLVIDRVERPSEN